MKCMVCERFSLLHICKHCQQTFLQPSLYTRTLENGVKVYSFYRYKEIQDLLFTKHTDLGFHIYTLLAHNSFKKFALEFHTKEKYLSLAIDDHVRNGYSHTAILNKALASYNIKPLYNKLRADNTITYSGKSKAFRKANPRNFHLQKLKADNIILVDDIITTGTTFTEAISVVQKQGKHAAFCLALCDAALK